MPRLDVSSCFTIIFFLGLINRSLPLDSIRNLLSLLSRELPRNPNLVRESPRHIRRNHYFPIKKDREWLANVVFARLGQPLTTFGSDYNLDHIYMVPLASSILDKTRGILDSLCLN